jgi:hypothetical protein
MFRKTLVLASVAGLLALSGAALAQDATNSTNPATSGNNTTGGVADDTGMSTLGIDISQYDAAKGMAGIPADLQAKVQSGCETVIADQANQNASVLSFCQKLTGKM